jgi:hypothetical protein
MTYNARIFERNMATPIEKRSVHESKSIKPHLSSLLLPLITTRDLLPCKAVIHAMGLRMGEGNEDYKLRKAVRSSLLLASKKGFRSSIGNKQTALSLGKY